MPPKLSDKAIEYIESNLSNDCSCEHVKADHENGKSYCNVAACRCDEFRPVNGSRLWKEASERDESGQW